LVNKEECEIKVVLMQSRHIEALNLSAQSGGMFDGNLLTTLGSEPIQDDEERFFVSLHR